MNSSKQSYQKLCTEFYNATKPRAGAREVKFYADFLEESIGPFLEAMCGSGRLLIPLLEMGFIIEGVDDSEEMLKSCSERCKAVLHKASLQEMTLPKKYGVIFIAIGSFQLIHERSSALQTLKKLHSHLLEGGSLLIETFIPWDAVKNCIEGEGVKDVASSFEKKVTLPDGSVITHKGVSVTYPKEQLEVSESFYEKAIKEKAGEREEEKLSVRWYQRYEMELLLKKAGFSKVQVLEASFELNPQATIYRAIK